MKVQIRMHYAFWGLIMDSSWFLQGGLDLNENQYEIAGFERHRFMVLFAQCLVQKQLLYVIYLSLNLDLQ